MKKVSIRIAIALMICAVSAASASAKVKSKTYTVGQNFVVAGTAVQAGTYEFRFDDEKNELTVIDRKTKGVVARTEARAEGFAKGSSFLGIQLAGNGAPLSIAGIAFDGKQVIRLSASAAQGK